MLRPLEGREHGDAFPFNPAGFKSRLSHTRVARMDLEMALAGSKGE